MKTRGPIVAALLLALAPRAGAQQASAFFPVRDYPTKLDGTIGIPWALALGDLDGDGHLDAATANESSDTVSILLARPEGGFQFPVTHSVAESPRALAFGDVDGDGHLDVVAGCLFASAVTILRGDGAGGVAQTVTIAVGGGVGALVLADVDDNGTLDIVTAGNSAITVLRFVGGVFQLPQMSSPGGNVGALRVADMDEDGLPDAVFLGDFGLTVMHGLGTGLFTSPQSVALATSGQALALGDLNGDGHVDAVVPLYAPTLTVLLGNGAGGFTPAPGSALPDYARDVVLADFDFDGHLDVACASLEFVELLRGNGTGALGAPFVASLPGLLYVPSLAVTDATGDGRPDVLAAEQGSNLVVLPGDGLGGVQSMASLGTPITVAAIPDSPVLADLDGDGHLDLVQGHATLPPIQVRHGDGHGAFGAPLDLSLGSLLTTRLIRAVDVNEDSARDLVVAATTNNGFGKLTIFLANGSGGYLAPADVTGTSWTRLFDAADVNGDGHVDLVVQTGAGGSQLQTWLNDGQANFTKVAGIASGNADSLVVADVDGDGKIDAALSYYGSSTAPKIYYGNGAGSFDAQAFLPLPSGSFGLLALDANEDGLPDLTTFSGYQVKVSLALAPRVFGAPVGFSYGGVDQPDSAFVTDLDRDGHADIVLDAGTDAVSVLLGDGTGAFAMPRIFGAWDSLSGLAAGDLDEDGRPDLVTASAKGQSFTWLDARLTVMLNRASSVGAWTDLGLGLGGALGVPQLTGTGTLAPLSKVSLALSGAKPLGQATLVIGSVAINAPFKGGTLVPLPTVVIAGLPLDASGQFAGSGTWYGGLPSGISTYFQAWVKDPQAPAGFAASNALRGETP